MYLLLAVTSLSGNCHKRPHEHVCRTYPGLTKSTFHIQLTLVRNLQDHAPAGVVLGSALERLQFAQLPVSIRILPSAIGRAIEEDQSWRSTIIARRNLVSHAPDSTHQLYQYFEAGIHVRCRPKIYDDIRVRRTVIEHVSPPNPYVAGDGRKTAEHRR